MTDRDKIRAEVVRLRNNYKYLSSTEAKYRYEAYTELIDFIESLPQELVSEDLEEAAEDYADKHPTCGLAKKTFIEGAKWNEMQFKKERLAHCDSLTKEQYDIEQDFVINHLKKYNRTPTFIDAIEYGERRAAKKGIIYEDKIVPTSYHDEPIDYCLDGDAEFELITQAVKDGILKEGDKVIVQIRKR